MSHFRKALLILFWLPARASVFFVRAYQKTVSPDHALLRHLFPYGYCRHEPTCSEYAIQRLQSDIYPVALVKITKRILSCNPWTKLSEEKMKKIIARL
jgi:putative membrane protein insertion efficiency factor